MSPAQQVIGGLVLIGVITVLTLSDRKTVEVGKVAKDWSIGLVQTVMGKTPTAK